MSRKQLPTYEVRDDIFDKILYELEYRVEKVAPEFFSELIYGYENKNTIYYEITEDGNEYLICKESVVNSYTDMLPDCTNWKQCRVRKVSNTESKLQHTITGSRAYYTLRKILNRYYADHEINFIFSKHSAEYDENLIQVHHNLTACEQGKIYNFRNCYKYDINGAHCAAIVEMFPKAEKELLRLYEERKIKPENKQLFNYAVGELCRKGFRTTYNWIVQRTTKKLNRAILTCGGSLLYANTDGFIVQDPEDYLETSKILDDFKLEYQGNVQFYRSKNYLLYQFGDKMTGSCRTAVRDKIDLRIGKVVEYKQQRNGNIVELTNIEYKEGVEIYEA
jgi:hypothetical protein